MGKNYASEIHHSTEFTGCENCSTGACFNCHYGRDAVELLEKIPSPQDTKIFWNTGK